MPDTRRVKFYNAGDRIQHTMRYSNPSGHDIHVIAMYRLDAPQGGFFEVPEESEIEGAIVRHTFDRDIARDWGKRGVIRVDANYEAKDDPDQDDVFPAAKTEALAIEKGKRLWKKFVQERVNEFLEYCSNVKSVGGVPRGADSTMQRYLKIVGMVDPTEQMQREAKAQRSDIETLTERLDRLEQENKELKERQQDHNEEEPEKTAAVGRKR